jgi:hypothetical protein
MTAMIQSLFRFIIGGVIVSAFAIVGDVLKPKSFAGLFGAAPSVALATLGLTIVADGLAYVGTEARSMMAGATAFFIYASLVSRIMMRYKFPAIWVASCSLPLWLGVAGGIYYFVLVRRVHQRSIGVNLRVKFCARAIEAEAGKRPKQSRP